MDHLETDYLVIGAGAMGMGFADALLALDGDAHITLVDRHHRPGGHWNDAYSFVRLHQPSVFYGLNSRPFGSEVPDTQGPNRGLAEMGTGQAVLDHFEQAMRQTLLPSGRVRFLSMTEHVGADAQGRQVVHSLLDGRATALTVRRKLVHATLTGTRVPSTHAPRYAVAPGVRCVPPNALPGIAGAHPRYTVVGAGKTAMDACQWLLHNGTDPARIRWVISNDAWFIDRANVQPGVENLPRFFESLALQYECVAQSASLADLFDRLEETGQLLRLDAGVRPTRYRCATVSQAELAELRRIAHVLRLGRVRSIAPTGMTLERGTAEVLPGELFIDCSAEGLASQPGVPVFEGDHAIHLQMVRQCAPSFSAAFTAAVECLVDGDAGLRNGLCAPVQLPQEDFHWVTMQATTLANRQKWSRHERLMQWLTESRLDYGTRMRPLVPAGLLERYVRAIKAASPAWAPLLAECAQRQAAGSKAAVRAHAREEVAAAS
ncbi:MAG: NAD(P)/FAD-dependent oxidoreductase [Aquabacterium sp.]|nr:MAG: NAD(P)/FAD-dependent oxidoreductase [Aquabacterium sp.]